MKWLKVISVVLMALFVTACSSTTNHTYKQVERKAFVSDQHLLFSLLNRPIPKDQQMMLAFANQQAKLSKDLYFVEPVMIIGPEQMIKTKMRPFDNLIANDQNAISISAPN